MPRYRLHLRNEHIDSPDQEGVDLPDLHAARAMAVAGIRDVLAHEVQKGAIDLRGHVDITDDSGGVLETIQFRNAALVIGDSRPQSD
ncbi:hypothetical protein U1839_11040 [Sphingomonas sp. RT2P30]|uniref:DUF6894 family protein n=1 Tax=Parasphingomonas halimpatiens TaxID=3096162 RepID=UPI002FC7A629